jgi:methylisocitrate lyase
MKMMQAQATQFRELIERDEVLPAMGGYDALSAKLIEQAGGEVIYMSGSSVSTSTHGYPDVGLTTMTEMVERAKQMVNTVEVPVFCDADTGYGNPVNVMRTVKEYESAGVAGIHIEDQDFPKKCGHFDDKSVIPTAEMKQKFRAAVDAREDDDFVIIARTDARAVHGVEEALNRLYEYYDAGADVLFFEAPKSREELEMVVDEYPDDVPLLANMTEGGETPLFTADEFEDIGFDIVLYPATGFKAAAKAMKDVFNEIAETGTQKDVMDKLTTWQGRNNITGLEEMVEIEREYAADD